MIDFVKLWVKDQQVIQKLQDSSLLTFSPSTNRHGLDNGLIAKFHGIEFSIYHPNRAEIRGSLHKFWNSYIKKDKLQNWNDFTRFDLIDSIETLCKIFGLDSRQLSIHNLEFGVNIELPEGQTSVAVLQKFLSYGTKRFEVIPLSSPGYYVEAPLVDFFVKAYDKGTQYDKPTQIVRFENKTVAMKKVPGIVVLSDLTDSNKLDLLGKSLIKTYDSCLIDEPIDSSQITDSEAKTLQLIRSIRDEKDWKSSHWRTITDKQRSRLRQRHEKVVAKYGATIRPMVRALIIEKWERLLLRDLAPEYALSQGGVVGSNSLIVVKPDQTEETPSFSALQPLLTKEERRATSREKFRSCLVTGIDISRQPSHTKFVTKSTLLDLYDHNPSEYERLAAAFLPARNRVVVDVALWAYIIAHNIRNKAHNSAHNLRRKVNKVKEKTMPLFPDYGLKLDAKSKELLSRFNGTQYEISFDN